MPDLQQRNYGTQENYAEATERMPERGRIPSEQEERRTMRVAAGGSALESLAGAAAIVLAIISFSATGEMAFYLTMVTLIVLGAGLILHGTSLAVRINNLMAEAAEDRFEEGITLEVVGGVAGITLAILALVGMVPTILASVAIIVYGAVLMLGSGTVTEVNSLRLERNRLGALAHPVSRRATVGAAGLHAAAGVAAVVLGILSLSSDKPNILVLIGALCVGGALFLSGGAISARMMTFLSRAR